MPDDLLNVTETAGDSEAAPPGISNIRRVRPSSGMLGNRGALSVPSNTLTIPSVMTPMPMLPGNRVAGGGPKVEGAPPASMVGSSAGGATPRKELVDSIIKRESGGNPKARGKKGELGLMQLMPSTAAMYGAFTPEQLQDPIINRQLGERYLGDLLKRYKGNETLALIAYNSGPGNVDKGRFLRPAVDYAHAVLTDSNQQLPIQQAQPGLEQSQPQEQPSMLARVGSALSSGVEGTAYAQEAPPGISNVRTVARTADPPVPGAAPPGISNMRSLPLGMSETIRLGPVGITRKPAETTGEATQEQKLGRMRDQILQLGTEMQDLWNKRIQPKLKAGQISSTGQGLEYTETGPMRSLGYQNDPDVVDWITKSGQFSQALNSYYAAGGGGRGGVSYFGEVTSPHVPHPPQGLREVMGVASPTGQQWDLQKQGEQLPILLHNLRRDAGREPTQQYQQWSPTEQNLLNKYGR